jgi:UDP-glucose 4-epimerase
MSKQILVTGGAGYVGSHTVWALVEQGYSVSVLDTLTGGDQRFVPDGMDIWQVDLADEAALWEVFAANEFEAVIHFAASIEVGEGEKDPQKFYFNNVVNTINLLSIMREFEVRNLVFSSSAAVYGLPEEVPITEDQPKQPVNTYGRTKWMMEQAMSDFARAYGLNYVALRYFNASGADAQNRSGEWHQPETHLIPLVLAAAAGDRENIKIFGEDYDTSDGTCIRDYIHVTDLAEAHVKAAEKLLAGVELNLGINLGTGHGYSVREIIDTAQEVTQTEIPMVKAERRPGDPARLVADTHKAKEVLDWQPQHSDLENIIQTAWQWYQWRREAE